MILINTLKLDKDYLKNIYLFQLNFYNITFVSYRRNTQKLITRMQLI